MFPLKFTLDLKFSSVSPTPQLLVLVNPFLQILFLDDSFDEFFVFLSGLEPHKNFHHVIDLLFSFCSVFLDVYLFLEI